MNPETLIGTVLGTCTLHKLIGQGGMGAVFLAQQSRPQRQVAVKVLWPVTPRALGQRTAFLEYFRCETDAIAALAHPNVMPVYEHGEYGGLVYRVMPYIAGGTLRDEMERQGPLPLARVANYLHQMAAALDVAHAHSIIHRNIKPTNILKTAEGRLLLTDFGLGKLLAERQTARISPTEITYIAPEQVSGGEVDARADLYALGVILYQMVTGTTPFIGNTTMRVPIQSPRMLRADLPPAVEQVMLRALAERPTDRYQHAQELASAFRLTLTAAGISLNDEEHGPSPSGNVTNRSFLTSHSLFDPAWQLAMATKNSEQEGALAANRDFSLPQRESETQKMDIVAKTSIPLPSVSGLLPPENVNSPTMRMRPLALRPVPHTPPPSAGFQSNQQTSSLTQGAGVPFPTPMPSHQVTSMASSVSVMSSALASTTSQLTLTGGMIPGGDANGQGTSATVKLTQPVKVVQVPVAGQPGRYMTGFLPVLPALEEPPSPFIIKGVPLKDHLKKNMKAVILVVVVFLVLLSSGTFWLVSSLSGQTTGKSSAALTARPDLTATAALQASATAQANTILTEFAE